MGPDTWLCCLDGTRLAGNGKAPDQTRILKDCLPADKLVFVSNKKSKEICFSLCQANLTMGTCKAQIYRVQAQPANLEDIPGLYI